jgi:uncharacterized membrane protein YphA (DoxX/SURF4 family)
MFESVEDKKVTFTLLVVMFLISGINKVLTFDDTVLSLKNKVNYELSDNLYKLAIVVVILLEIIAPIIIIRYAINNDYKEWAYYSVIGLIIFTILATIIYHFPDFTNYKKSIPFWANISLLGGLLLLMKAIRKEN